MSKHAGRYTPAFVQAVLNTVPKFRSCTEVLVCNWDGNDHHDALPFEVLATEAETDPREVESCFASFAQESRPPIQP